jgi:hypothetical protein
VYWNAGSSLYDAIMLAIWAYVLITLAAARVTRLVTKDRIALGLRKGIVAKYGEGYWLAYLVFCPFCVGFWLSLPATVAWMLLTLPLHLWWLAVPAWPAMSYLIAPVLLKLEGD